MFAHVPLRWQQQCDIVIFVPIPIGSMYGIYANIGGILMVNVTIYTIHGSYGIVALSDIFWRNTAHMKTRRPFPRLHACHPCSHSTVIQSMSWQTVKSIVDSLHVNALHRLPSCLERRLFTSFADESHGSRAKEAASILNHLLSLKHKYYMGISAKKKRKNTFAWFGWMSNHLFPASSSSHTASTQRILYFLPAFVTCTFRMSHPGPQSRAFKKWDKRWWKGVPLWWTNSLQWKMAIYSGFSIVSSPEGTPLLGRTQMSMKPLESVNFWVTNELSWPTWKIWSSQISMIVACGDGSRNSVTHDSWYVTLIFQYWQSGILEYICMNE